MSGSCRWRTDLTPAPERRCPRPYVTGLLAGYNRAVEPTHSLAVEVDGVAVMGKRHSHPDGHVCVHILAPFGRCAVDLAPARLAVDLAHEDLLRRLYGVCQWAEAQAARLRQIDEHLRGELAGDASLLGPEALTAHLTEPVLSAERLDVLCERHGRYEVALQQHVERIARELECPWPEIAGACWELLAMNGFYNRTRHPQASSYPLAVE